MPLLSQTIERLTDGVSQRPPQQRSPSQGTEQINGLSSLAEGLLKRPHSLHIAKLVPSDDANFAGYGSAHIHTVDRTAAERYRVIMVDGDLRVFDAVTGLEHDVTFPDGKTYLDCNNASQDLRAVTVGDFTFITNRTKTVKKGSSKSATRAPEALIFVRQADYSTTFRITLDQTEVKYTTVAGASPDSRAKISTDTIASELQDAIESSAALNDFTVERFGSTLYLTRADGSDFSISGKDGLADGGMVVVKKSIQNFDDLPEFAKDGFLVEVTGDPGSETDDYWVVYDDQGLPAQAGVWRETVAPSILLQLDPATMPHQLVLGGSHAEGVSRGLPPLPVLGFGGADGVFSGWATAYGGTPDTEDQVATANQPIFADITDAPNFATEYHCTYDVTFTPPGGNPWGSGGIVEIFVCDSGNHAGDIIYRKAFGNGSATGVQLKFTRNLFGKTLKFQATGNSTTSIAFRSTPALLVAGPNAIIPAISFSGEPTKVVTFNVEEVYPAGATVRLFVDSTNCDYTVPSGGKTGAEVATAITSTVDALSGITATNPHPGIVEITKTGGIVSVVASIQTWDIATHLHDPNLTLTPGGIVGLVVKNISDGSQGTITSNGSHTIVVSSLAGGAVNTFDKDDVFEVVGADSTSFVFSQAEWRDREVGSVASNPWPSFVGGPVNEVFFHSNRLGFLSGSNVILTASGDIFNFFRESARDLRDNDPIDVSSTSAGASVWHSAVNFNDALYLISSLAQARLEGAPVLTPKTVSLPVPSKYETSFKLRPVVNGSSMFYGTHKHGHVKVWEYYVDSQGIVHKSDDLSVDLPRYIAGEPLQMVGSADDGFLAVLASGDRRSIYVYKYADGEQSRVLNSWSKWTFAPSTVVVGIDVIDGSLGVVTKQVDGVFLSTLDLNKREEEDGSDVALLDRRVDGATLTPTTSLTSIAADNFHDTDGVRIKDHTPQSGFGSWLYPPDNEADAPDHYAKVTNNKATSVGWEHTGIICSLDLADDNFEAWVDSEYGGADYSGDRGAGLWFWFAGAQTVILENIGTHPEGMRLSWQRTAPEVVKLVMDRYDGSTGYATPQETVVMATDIPFHIDSNLRLGVRVKGEVVTVWTEPGGGGDRVNHGLYSPPTTFRDGDHKRIGFATQIAVAALFIPTLPAIESIGAAIVDEETVVTHWQLPYSLAINGSEGVLAVVNRSTGEELVVTRPTATTFTVPGDFTDTELWIGVVYDFTYILSTIFYRTQNTGRAETAGRLQLRYIDVLYLLSKAFTVTVDVGGGRTPIPYVFSSADPVSGKLHVPVQANNEEAVITITNSTPWQSALSGIDWEGHYTVRSRRV